MWAMPHTKVQTKFLRLRHPVTIGSYFGDWRVCWLGGWDRSRVFYVVMVERIEVASRHMGQAPSRGRESSR